MHEPIETVDHAGLRIEIHQEEDSSFANPRDNDNAAILVCSHRNYRLGDREPTDTEREAAQRGLLQRYLELTEGALGEVKPLYLYDHSGISISTGSFIGRAHHAEWDSGMVGFAYVPRDNPCGTDAEHAEACLEEEVKEYDSYLRGEVYYFLVKNADGEVLDSCGGFIGDTDYVLEEAKASAECEARDIAVNLEPDIELALYAAVA